MIVKTQHPSSENHSISKNFSLRRQLLGNKRCDVIYKVQMYSLCTSVLVIGRVLIQLLWALNFTHLHTIVQTELAYSFGSEFSGTLRNQVQ